ncbi:MAG: energy-coupling factor transporter transmembrane component T [Bacillota bacterium]|nr:energy-coupling factor transporter transmembrane component T [Bacillota bacterium]
MKNLTLGQFYPADSFLHRMDPRAKLTALFIYYIFLFLLDDNLGFGVAIATGAVILLASGVPFRVYWRGSWLLILFVALAAALNIFFTSGTVLWSYGALVITEEGIYSAVYMAIRLILLITSAYALTYTTTPMAITNALEAMGQPLCRFKIPVHDVSMMMSIALRFIPTIMDEAETIKKAQRSRGVDFSLRRPHIWLQNTISLVVPLFVSAFRRSDDLALAMEARGYDGSPDRTMYRELRLKISDILAMCFFGALLMASILYRWLL